MLRSRRRYPPGQVSGAAACRELADVADGLCRHARPRLQLSGQGFLRSICQVVACRLALQGFAVLDCHPPMGACLWHGHCHTPHCCFPTLTRQCHAVPLTPQWTSALRWPPTRGSSRPSSAAPTRSRCSRLPLRCARSAPTLCPRGRGALGPGLPARLGRRLLSASSLPWPSHAGPGNLSGTPPGAELRQFGRAGRAELAGCPDLHACEALPSSHSSLTALPPTPTCPPHHAGA